MSGLTAVLLLVALARVVATGARHWRLPAPSVLVVVGVLIGLLPFVPEIPVSPHAISVSALTPLNSEMAFVLGAVLAGTDPVAVTGLGRRLSLPPRVQVMVQAESLFNDATSLVLVRVAAGIAVASAAADWGAAGGQFLLLAGGGTLIGGAVA